MDSTEPRETIASRQQFWSRVTDNKENNNNISPKLNLAVKGASSLREKLDKYARHVEEAELRSSSISGSELRQGLLDLIRDWT